MSAVELPTGVQVQEFNIVEDGAPEYPLVLLNGIGAGIGNWGRFPQALGRYCVAVDVSRAEPKRPLASMHEYSETVIKTVDSLGHDQVDLLGLSWGGALAQETAVRHGDRLGKVVLAATLHGMQSVPPKWSAMAALMQPDRSSKRFHRLAGRIYGGDIREDPSLVQEVGIERSTDTEAYNRQLWAIRTWTNTLLRLRRIHNPTLVIAGEDDPIARPINSRMMAAFIPLAELHVVLKDAGGGHLFLHTRPEESAQIVNEFLDRDRPAGLK